MWNLTLPLGVSVEQRIHYDCSAGVSKQLASETDQPATWHAKLHSYAAVAMVVHVRDFAFAFAELLHHHANECFRHIDGQVLHGFHELAIDSLGDDLGFSNGQLIPL